MNVVIDANILFAILIKNSFSYKIIFNSNFNFFTPEYILVEFEKYKEEIIKKTERTKEELFRLLEILKRKITIIQLEELLNYIDEAEEITPDSKDLVYIALAMKIDAII